MKDVYDSVHHRPKVTLFSVANSDKDLKHEKTPNKQLIDKKSSSSEDPLLNPNAYEHRDLYDVCSYHSMP